MKLTIALGLLGLGGLIAVFTPFEVGATIMFAGFLIPFLK
jgi:hypothetical protein